MALYNGVLSLLENIGFFNMIIPFLLVYAVMYGLLSKYKLLGNPFSDDREGKVARSLISMISASVGFLVVGAVNIVLAIKNLLPYIVLFILTVFFLLLAIAPFISEGGEVKLGPTQKRIFIALVSIIFTIVVLFTLGIFNYLLSLQEVFSQLAQNEFLINLIETLIILGILFGFVVWVTKAPKVQSPDNRSR
ncbi:MAG: hypothetical protein ACP5G1_00665 [Nanopusillaceae archaeon]